MARPWPQNSLQIPKFARETIAMGHHLEGQPPGARNLRFLNLQRYRGATEHVAKVKVAMLRLLPGRVIRDVMNVNVKWFGVKLRYRREGISTDAGLLASDLLAQAHTIAA